MAQTKYTNGSGVAEIWANIKNYITAQLLGKADSVHTHTKSDITDFPTIPSKTSDLTNDSGFLTSHQDLSGYVPKSGGAVLTGTSIGRENNTGNLDICGGTNFENGASIALRGKDTDIPNQKGVAVIGAADGSNQCYFYLFPNGIARWGNKNIAMAEDTVPRSGGAVMTGSLLASPTTDSIGFGYGWGSGGTIYTYSPTESTVGWQGAIRLEPLKTTSIFKTMQIYPSGTWTWNGTACQITSDQRYKQQITEIDDKLLDAWESVDLVQFKYNDAVDQKGDKARLHTGYVVQQIDEACQKHNIDISEYGLYCHEEYPEETEEVEVTQEDGTTTKETKVVREANEHYSLRYTEALIVECKYLRRCIARLTARIEELEKGNNVK